MNRGLWFVAGTAVGAYAVTRARRAAEVFTYDGLHDRLSGLFVGARLFTAEVKAGAAEKETELRERLAHMPDGTQAREIEGVSTRPRLAPRAVVPEEATKEPSRRAQPPSSLRIVKGPND